MKEFPKTFKYGRVFRVKLKKNEKARNFLNVSFFEFGLKALENGKITIKHLNSITRLLKKLFKKNISIKYNISLITPVTKKPLETRMGKGKGERNHWECSLKKGCIIIEIGNLSFDDLKYGLKLVSDKLPVLTKIVKLTY
jgi:large subunit ribosomal protein L16